MKIDIVGAVNLLRRPRVLVLLSAAPVGFVALHLVLEKIGYDPLPLLPLVALVACFVYSYYLALQYRSKKEEEDR